MGKRGPKTPAGRRAVRFNAIRHGVSSESPVIPGVESEEEWQEFRAAWVASLEPVGFVEEQFAEAMALLWWRRQRAHRYERDAATLRRAAADGDAAIAAAYGPSEREYEEDRETLAGLERIESLLRDLPRQADNVPLPPEHASSLAELLRDEFGAPGRRAAADAGLLGPGPKA